MNMPEEEEARDYEEMLENSETHEKVEIGGKNTYRIKATINLVPFEEEEQSLFAAVPHPDPGPGGGWEVDFLDLTESEKVDDSALSGRQSKIKSLLEDDEARKLDGEEVKEVMDKLGWDKNNLKEFVAHSFHGEENISFYENQTRKALENLGFQID